MTRPAIFITGAAAGIGRATARLFAARGWCVGLYDIDSGGVERLRAELGDAAVSGYLDVRDAAALTQALERFTAFSGGRLDVMFNNAGILAVGHFEDIALARHHALVDVNLKGVINGCLAALPHLRRTPGSRVINMSSASAIYGSPAYASYSATKFAVKGLTEALDIEWARHGVRVMDVLPLFVNTAMVTDIEQPPSVGKLGVHLQAEDIAAVIWRAAHWNGRRRVHWYPGAQTRLLALVNKLAPAWLNRYTVKQVSGY
ncbi:NADP-dependent 3-hydroxy acid dehydrogenase YdfG [Fontimonas thermophila]|uniref:NADP-dependent 3-hydroxy acid dehydrogenase YdfG n=1 Tax=Fontimonas thermophila TaxID=1076937 RepID=A0A1I2IX70_9GAMM|nr:SDR family oxidoreductase [Fontimonas thermophila]SFF46894.1 NADP-dependent 3-hydroxy acid dehydrogenase YdfG [Fontimonas thermophila]